jgi:hypothetical protein
MNQVTIAEGILLLHQGRFTSAAELTNTAFGVLLIRLKCLRGGLCWVRSFFAAGMGFL